MRISGGKARGVELRVSKNAVHRPAMDRLRQSIFSSLGAAVDNARVCDLFAGTGSYGLEALSRGASSAKFLEKNRKACSMIKDNLKIVAKSMGQPRLEATVLPGDAIKASPIGDERFDLIFVDPPYNLIESSQEQLFRTFDRILEKDGLVVFEMPGQMTFEPRNWELRKRLGKGRDQPTACIYRRVDPS